MKSPVNGGAFYDEKTTNESKFGPYFRKTEHYNGGLQTTPQPQTPTRTEGFKFGINLQLLIGIKAELEIRRKR